jgi:hypothetical protein
MAGKKRGRKPICPVSFHFTDYLRKCGGDGGRLCVPGKWHDQGFFEKCPCNFKRKYLKS